MAPDLDTRGAPRPDRWPDWPTPRLLLFVLLLLGGDYLLQILLHAVTADLFVPVLAGSLLGVVVPCALVARAGGGSLGGDFHLDRIDPGLLAAAVIVAAASLVPTSVLAGLSARLHPVDPQWIRFYQEHLPRTGPQIVLAVVAVVVAAPLAEELVFRGLLYRIARRTWGVPAATIVSALVFGLIHGEPWFLLGLVGLGAILAYLYEATGSLVAPVATHALHNAVSLAVMIEDRSALGEVPVMRALDWLLLAASLAALAATATLLARRVRRLEDLGGSVSGRGAPPPGTG